MTRFVNLTGTGLQLWEVSRLYVELYSAWPLTTPAEVWASEVIAYNLPRTRLGGCGEGSLTVVTEPGRLPAGFQAMSHPGQPVRCLLDGVGRLALVVAVLPNGDEWVIYAGALGKAQPAQPRLWNISLIGPDSLRMQEFVDAAAGGTWTSGGGGGWQWEMSLGGTNAARMPTPAGRAPISSTSRIYSPFGPVGATSSAYSVPAENVTPLTTLEEWWRTALQNDPMGEFCVGPDLVFAAGTPVGTSATRANYILDSRGFDLKPAGREIPPYLTHIRGYVAGGVVRNHSRASSVFLPSRTATYAGNSRTEVKQGSGDMGTSYGGGGTATGTGQTAGGSASLSLGSVASTNRLQTVSVVVTLNLSGITGEVHGYIVIQGTSSTGYPVLWSNNWKAVSGNYVIKVDMDGKNIASATGFIINAGITPQEATASGQISFSASGSYRYEYDVFSVSYDAVPPGLDYPMMTDEAWTFSLPGMHAGPLLVGNLPNGSQYASTVIRVEDNKLWTELRCGPLPWRNSPTAESGRWKG